MKATADAKALARAVKAAAPLADTPSHLRVLSCVRLSATEDAIEVMASNIETSIRVRVDAEVAEPGVVLVAARPAARVAGTMTGSVDLDDADGLTFTSGERTATLLSVPGADWPRLNWPEGDPTPLGDAWGAICGLTFATTIDPTRSAALSGVKFDPDGTAVACDSHRLAWSPMPEGFDALVPAAAIDLAAKALGADVSVSTTARTAAFTDGNATLMTTLLAEQYPNWRPMVPSGARRFELEVDAEALGDALAALAALDADDMSNAVRLTTTDDVLTLARSTKEVGQMFDTVPASGEMPECWFQLHFLRQAMKAAGATTVRLAIDGGEKPLLIHGEGIEQLIMPLRGRSL